MPKIERSIPYTLAAYSGGIIKHAGTIVEKKIRQSSMDYSGNEDQNIHPENNQGTVRAR